LQPRPRVTGEKWWYGTALDEYFIHQNVISSLTVTWLKEKQFELKIYGYNNDFAHQLTASLLMGKWVVLTLSKVT